MLPPPPRRGGGLRWGVIKKIMKKIFFFLTLISTLLPIRAVFAIHGTACTGDAQCGAEPNISCIYGLGVCAPIQAPSTCLTDASCTSSLKPSCNTQTRLCEQGSTQVCPTGQIFNVNENKCVAADKSCPSGYYFDDNTEKCQKLGTVPGATECSTTQPCSDTKKKCINNLCVSPEFGECLSNADCAPGLSCVGKGLKKTCTGTISEPPKPFTPIAPTLQIPIPTLKPFNIKDVILTEPDAGGNRYVVVPFIAQYIVAVYKYGISIAFIVSIVVVMIAGFRWMTAGGNTSIIGQAKNMIATTLVGMILLLGSYVLLSTVNPELLKAGVIKIRYVAPSLLEYVAANNEGTEDQIAGATCPNEADFKTIEDMVDVTLPKEDVWLVGEVKAALAKAIEAAKTQEGYTLQILSAGRKLEKQQKLWQNALTKNNGDEELTDDAVCKPSCTCPHLTGRAIDICIPGLTSCQLSQKEFRQRKLQLNPNEQKLEQIMKSAGFIRYCKEWWHFEYNSGRTQNVC